MLVIMMQIAKSLIPFQRKRLLATGNNPDPNAMRPIDLGAAVCI